MQFKKATTEELKSKLTALQYEVTQHEATENHSITNIIRSLDLVFM